MTKADAPAQIERRVVDIWQELLGAEKLIDEIASLSDEEVRMLL